MAQPKGTHFVVTASDTDTGAPIYLAKDGSWSRSLREADAFESESVRDARIEAAAKQQRAACDPYWFSVALEGKAIDPLSAREAIRAQGPTTPLRRPD